MTLTPDDQARIQAEEAYRIQLRTQKRRVGCWRWGCGLLVAPIVLFFAFWGLVKVFNAVTPDDPRQAQKDAQVEFVVNCENQIQASLKAPKTAKISSPWPDQVLTTVSGFAWNGYVDAENSFGANIRTDFRCSGPAASPTVVFE
ncbi:hypothetical protein [Deinococcus phoenicis]|uniref:hypothetical protein n=1 Tax=Deinococcus phoenicis TaxID=1476583 RepID=UPI0012696E04|nr:hypothetical protein [Deinococcus phoenicis]